MPDPRINLKNPVLAGILAFLVPGAGHLYQGRMFKSVIYAVCIWGTYLTGNVMSGWRAVQAPRMSEVSRRIPLTLKFAAQSGVGLPSLYAIYQNQRAAGPANRDVTSISSPMNQPFQGAAELRPELGERIEGTIEGTISLKPETDVFGKSIGGSLKGTFRPKGGEAKPIEWPLEQVVLGRRIQPGLERSVRASVLNTEGRETQGELIGHIPRSILDGFGAPATEADDEELHRKLGKFHELAMVLTWIAGLLNVLATWDAIDGPAYGYGDEAEKALAAQAANGATPAAPAPSAAASAPRDGSRPQKVPST